MIAQAMIRISFPAHRAHDYLLSSCNAWLQSQFARGLKLQNCSLETMQRAAQTLLKVRSKNKFLEMETANDALFQFKLRQG